MTAEKIGFVGTGLMGQGMATNLLKAGYPVSVMAHRNRAPVEALVDAGATEVKSLADMAANATVIHICAPGSPQVEAIVDGMLDSLQADTVIIDCSTADPTSTAKLADALADKGCHMVDAPLGGTPVQAAEGTLAAMVGADDAVFERIKPVIGAWAKAVVHLGPTGTGHKMKLLNNMLSLGYAALYSEALALSEAVGITTNEFDSVIRGSRMDCGFYQTFMGYAVEGNREAHKFTLSNALKDSRYLEAMAQSVDLANPVGNAIKNSFAQAVAADASVLPRALPRLLVIA